MALSPAVERVTNLNESIAHKLRCGQRLSLTHEEEEHIILALGVYLGNLIQHEHDESKRLR